MTHLFPVKEFKIITILQDVFHLDQPLEDSN